MMNIIRPFLFLSFLTFACHSLFAQVDQFGTYTQTSVFHASVEAQGILTSKNYVPFWMRSNQYGSVPLPGASGSLIGTARIDYDSTTPHLVDWGAGVEVRGDLGSSSRATLIEGYAKLKISIFELKAGRTKDIMGLVDTTLSSGAFSVSGNALGIPKVQLAIPSYWTLPIFGDLFAVKGNFAHGWIGNQPLGTGFLTYRQEQTYFHQSSFYARLGKPDWKLKLYAGFNHQAYWGFDRVDRGYKLSDLKTFEYVVLGRTYKGSKIGNHLGSVDLGLTYDFPTVKLTFYRQNFYDEGALAKLANLKDGLNGISLQNTGEDLDDGGFHWQKVLFEFFYSKDQAGYPDSKATASGDENYYNNDEYGLGWSYKGMTLGNPFITPAKTTRTGFPNDPADYFNNNRVVAFHGGVQAIVGDYSFTAKASYSLDFGTFGTSIYGASRGRTFYPPQYGIWKEVHQFSGYLEVNRSIADGWQAGAVAGLDRGGLFYNSAGLILKLKKSF